MALVKSHIPWAVKLDAFPSQSGTLTYNTQAQSPTWKDFDPEQIEVVGGTNSETNAGTYYRHFKPLRKYVFPNGTKKVYLAPWTINKAAGRVTLSETSGEVKIKFTRAFTVSRLGDGTISASSSNTDVATVSVNGSTVTIRGVSVGDVTITVSVAEGTNYLATSTTYACRSRKTQITIPTVTNTTKTYTGSSQSPTITNAPSTSLVARTGTVSAISYSPTAYSFTYTIRDTDAYEWSNGTTAPRTYTWRINKKVFAQPEQSGTLNYTGSEQKPSWNFGSTSLISISGDTGTDATSYTATFTLNDAVNCEWWDGSVTDKTAQWKIDKANVTVPSQAGTLTYDYGWEMSPSWYNYDYSLMEIGGTQYKKDAGTYYATFTLKDSKNYQWANGSQYATISVKWEIQRRVIDKPSFDNGGTYYERDYDPNETTVIMNEINGFDERTMTTNSLYTQLTNVGTYSCNISPNGNACWYGGSTDAITFTYKINTATFSGDLEYSGSLFGEVQLTDRDFNVGNDRSILYNNLFIRNMPSTATCTIDTHEGLNKRTSVTVTKGSTTWQGIAQTVFNVTVSMSPRNLTQQAGARYTVECSVKISAPNYEPRTFYKVITASWYYNG